jgi:hypothetical protein
MYFVRFGCSLRGKWLRHIKIVEALKRLLAKAFGVELQQTTDDADVTDKGPTRAKIPRQDSRGNEDSDLPKLEKPSLSWLPFVRKRVFSVSCRKQVAARRPLPSQFPAARPAVAP